jgi:hypothetical protein
VLAIEMVHSGEIDVWKVRRGRCRAIYSLDRARRRDSRQTSLHLVLFSLFGTFRSIEHVSFFISIFGEDSGRTHAFVCRSLLRLISAARGCVEGRRGGRSAGLLYLWIE